jgi:hypothetical protein
MKKITQEKHNFLNGNMNLDDLMIDFGFVRVKINIYLDVVDI